MNDVFRVAVEKEREMLAHFGICGACQDANMYAECGAPFADAARDAMKAALAALPPFLERERVHCSACYGTGVLFVGFNTTHHCEKCGGSGRMWLEEGPGRCSACNGSGSVDRWSTSPGLSVRDTCEKCSGSGHTAPKEVAK